MPPEHSASPHDAWIELPDKSTLTLKGDCHFGRIEGNEIVNPDPRISRRHSVVRRDGMHFVLIDLGSTNGTYLNDSRIYKPTRLKDGDVIMVGALRYIFCQPIESADITLGDDSMANRTIVAVAKISCWLLLLTTPEPAGEAWAEEGRQALAAAGAGLRRVRAGSYFAHWRDRKFAPEAVRSVLLDLARRPAPAGARIAMHHGAVRVGPATNPTEENLLGADVTFTYKLEATAAQLNQKVVLSEQAMISLGLAAETKALGPQSVRDIPGQHALYTF